MKNIIIALDGLTTKEALSLAEETQGLVWGYKIHEHILREGFGLIQEFKKFGKVFVDFKFHDTPTTVGAEVHALVEKGADLITVHASGGVEMLKEAVKQGGDKITAITILTSLDEQEVAHTYNASAEEMVRRLSTLASEAGVKNIVCSPHEINIVKQVNSTLNVITPGIREVKTTDDQKRTMTAREAVVEGANLLVIGRPITKAPDPRQALEDILATLKTNN
ncbi:MAG: orotidine-5'-phosphate decarboxylase [Patescibacteria group bacterium]